MNHGPPYGNLPFDFNRSSFQVNSSDSLTALNTTWNTFGGSSSAQNCVAQTATTFIQSDGFHAVHLPLCEGSWDELLQEGQFEDLGALLNTAPFERPGGGSPASATQSPTQHGSKPFSCTYPGCTSKKGFSRKYELQRHMKKHSRSQVFPCPVVGCRFQSQEKAFYRADKLQSHMKACHPRLLNNNGNGRTDDIQAGIQNSTHHATSAMTYNDPQRSSQE